MANCWLSKKPRLQCASGAIAALGHIEDDGMGMELRSGVAIDRPRRVMLELGGNELAGGLGGIVAADPRLSVSLQLRERDSHGFPVGLANAVIAADQCGERDRFGGGNGCW